MKTSVFIAASVDGYIARKDGSIDWLENPDYALSGEDYGYREFFDSVDALVMGRNTFETVLHFNPWPYANKPVFVLSSREIIIPEAIKSTVSPMNATPEEVIRILKQRSLSHLYIDGGITIQRFLRDSLINEMIITRIPVLLGCGIPLFGPLQHDIHLRHINTRHYKNGFVQTRYEILPGR